jgi:hypothetical protein
MYILPLFWERLTKKRDYWELVNISYPKNLKTPSQAVKGSLIRD